MSLTVDLQYSDDAGGLWITAASLLLSGNGWVTDEECITIAGPVTRIWRTVLTNNSGTAQLYMGALTYIDQESPC